MKKIIDRIEEMRREIHEGFMTVEYAKEREAKLIEEAYESGYQQNPFKSEHIYCRAGLEELPDYKPLSLWELNRINGQQELMKERLAGRTPTLDGSEFGSEHWKEELK